MKLHQAILMLLPLLTRRRNSRRYSWSDARRERSGPWMTRDGEGQAPQTEEGRQLEQVPLKHRAG